MKETQWLAILALITTLTCLEPASAAPAIGTVVAWGSNTNGESNAPSDLTNAIAIAAGIEHSLALRADHTVVAWGADEYNQTDVPPGLNNVVAISTRGYHNLVLKSDGTVVAWGLNNTGQLEIPPDLSNVIAIAAGGNHNLALKSDGTVVAWGWGVYGETNVPPDLTGVVAITAGSHHSVAQKSDGTIVVWGNPGYDISVPAGLNNVAVVKAGRFYNLALRKDGTVVAWGEDNYGQTDVPADWTNIVQIAAGGFHNLALRADGTATGFGLDNNGQADIPANLKNILALAAGTTHSLALVSTFSYTYDPTGAVVSMAITSPSPGSTLSNAQLTVQGTAASANGIYGVFYQLNGGAWQNASSADGFADWSGEVTLTTSANVLRAYVVDSAGYVSPTNTVAFNYQVQGNNTLRLQISGQGRVVPNWVGDHNLKVGKTYSLTAIPAAGWTFYQWTGDTNSTNPKLRFVMQPSMSLTANFIPSPYPALQGSFAGLFYGDTNDPQWAASSCGALTLRLTRNGTYSGKISLLSGAASFSGKAQLEADNTNLVVVPIAGGHGKSSALSGALQIDLTDPTQSLFGALRFVSGKGSAAVTHTATFQGQMLRAAKANPDVGTYNFNLDQQTAADGPMGGSFGRATVKAGNAALVTLSLADQNATATAGTAETVGGLVPFFAPLYGHKGLASGWLQLSQGSVLSSNVLWFKAANTSKTCYPQGFLQSLGGAGSLFKPAKGSQLIPASTGTIALNDGARISATNTFTVANGVCKVPPGQNPNAIAFSFAPSTGLLSGSLVSAGTHKRLPLKGILISTSPSAPPSATGYFLEPDKTGSVGISFQ